jgi:hypothetical protein
MMLPHLVRQARRRLIWNNLFATALCQRGLARADPAPAGGNWVLDWQWAADSGRAAVYGIYHLESEPDPYAAAQVVDRRLALDRHASTAFYFDQESRRGACRTRFARGSTRARSACARRWMRRAIPFAMPRATYAAAALLLVASSLLALATG